MSRPLTPRNNRTLIALMNGSIMREYLDQVARCSDGPDLIAGLSRKGLLVQRERIEQFVKTGNLQTCLRLKRRQPLKPQGAKHNELSKQEI